jgi:hypothetical protein
MMSHHGTEADRSLVQEALQLRHDVEALAEQSRRLYERANSLVERTRHLTPPQVRVRVADLPTIVSLH